ncbi:MAG TPA: sigma-54 dependent transcriptional regulator [Polyangiales bacterium]|nr:sigma-54 dependent transcriptional regulator [Polyangiales bacterium]
MRASVLVVDDEPLIRQTLVAALTREGYGVSSAASAAAAGEMFASERPDVVIIDLILGDGHGLDLLRHMRSEAPETKFLVITAQGSVEEAVNAMKLGAYDFVRKPFDLAEVIAGIRNALHMTSLEQQVAYFARRDRGRSQQTVVASASRAMQRVLQEARLIASNDVPVVLVLGESGSGKQLLARMLHESSPAASGAFVELNCSAIPDTLVESELFGHERGAFSDARSRKLGLVEIADGGTLFLDEIGDLNLAAQAKLLTFLEQRSFRRLGSTVLKQVNARVIAATNRDLASMVQAKSFREDLWYRLGGMTLRIPPLRERTEDIAVLIQAFLAEANRTYGRRWTGISDQALGVLTRYRWPGNIRELRAVIHRIALMNETEIMDLAHLPSELISAALAEPEPASQSELARGTPLGGIPTLAEVEAVHIRRVLALCNGNKTAAAQLLGITRQTLAKKLDAEDAGRPRLGSA